jgi:hypothetical protein
MTIIIVVIIVIIIIIVSSSSRRRSRSTSVANNTGTNVISNIPAVFVSGLLDPDRHYSVHHSRLHHLHLLRGHHQHYMALQSLAAEFYPSLVKG